MALDRVAIAERSVYVRGFPPGLVQEGDVRQLFQQFGTITNIALDVHKVNQVAHFHILIKALWVSGSMPPNLY